MPANSRVVSVFALSVVLACGTKSFAQAKPDAGMIPPSPSRVAAPFAQSTPPGASMPSQAVLQAQTFSDPNFEGIINRISLEGWKPKDVVATVPHILTGSSMEEPINQRAAILQEYGMKNIIARQYSRGQRQIDVDVHVFATRDGAYGAYKFLRQGASTVVRRGDASSEDDQSISFLKDRYVVVVRSTAEDDDEAKGAVKQIADRVEASILGHNALPQLLNRMPIMDRVRGSEKIVMGPIAARKFFPAPFIGNLDLGNAEGCVADYQLPEPYRQRLRIFCVEFANPTDASRAYYNYVTALNGTKRIPSESPETAIYKVNTTLLSCKLRGSELILISGARKRDALNYFAIAGL